MLRRFRVILAALLLFCVLGLLQKLQHHNLFVKISQYGVPQGSMWSRIDDPNNAFTSLAPRDLNHWKQLEDDILPHPSHPVNPHNFEYIINNPELCPANETLSYAVYIHASPDASTRRKSLRETWAQPNLLRGHPSRLVFFMGRPDDPQLIESLKKENDEHHDIVMVDFHDAYNNMTYKAISAFKWFSVYCSNVKYLIKSDDDVYVDVVNIVHKLDTEYRNKTRFFLCAVYRDRMMAILRDKPACAKWCVPPHILPGQTHYPEYCSGSAYVLTSDITLDLYNASLHSPYFFIDDAYATGLLKLKIQPKIQSYSLGLQKFDFYPSKIMEKIAAGKMFPNRYVVHDMRHNPLTLRYLFADNLSKLKTERIHDIAPEKWADIINNFRKHNISLNLNI